MSSMCDLSASVAYGDNCFYRDAQISIEVKKRHGNPTNAHRIKQKQNKTTLHSKIENGTWRLLSFLFMCMNACALCIARVLNGNEIDKEEL